VWRKGFAAVEAEWNFLLADINVFNFGVGTGDES